MKFEVNLFVNTHLLSYFEANFLEFDLFLGKSITCWGGIIAKNAEEYTSLKNSSWPLKIHKGHLKVMCGFFLGDLSAFIYTFINNQGSRGRLIPHPIQELFKVKIFS